MEMPTEKGNILAVLVIAALVVATTTVSALLSASKTFSNTGNVKAVGVGVYVDSGCSQPLSSINWGTLTPGSTSNFTAYVRDEGTTALVLSKTIGNWSPSSASSYITLNWNREGYVLGSGATVQTIFTLLVSSNISGISSFSFDITITGTEST